MLGVLQVDNGFAGLGDVLSSPTRDIVFGKGSVGFRTMADVWLGLVPVVCLDGAGR